MPTCFQHQYLQIFCRIVCLSPLIINRSVQATPVVDLTISKGFRAELRGIIRWVLTGIVPDAHNNDVLLSNKVVS